MADPTNPTTPSITIPSAADLNSWNTFNTLISDSNQKLGDTNIVSSVVAQTFDTLRQKLSAAGISLDQVNSLVGDQATKFGMITTAVLGAKEAYNNLANLPGVDTSKLVTFSDQISSLLDTIKQGPGTSLFAGAVDTIIKKMEKSKASFQEINQVWSDLQHGITGSAKAFFVSADNVSRLQNALMQTVIQGSGAGAFFDHISSTVSGVGKDFENLNQVTDVYQQKLQQTMSATHLSNEQIANYAAQITRMPGGLKALIDTTSMSGNQTDLLTASIQYATGAARKQEDVFNDMRQAMEQYGVSGESALRFSARMTDVADALGAQVNDVQEALRNSASAFKMFAGLGADVSQMTQGMSDSMKGYVQQLVNVDVPVQNAIDMFKNYTGQVEKMTIGQKAFLSTMTGGTGGLQGAFQIDKLIRSGDFEGLRKKVEDTIKKMTGPIVSLDDATKSQSAAAQYTRQIQILQQGPLGSMARSPQEAENLLEALRTGAKMPGTGKTAEQSLQETIQRGQKWEEMSHTELVDINTGIQALVMKAGAENLITARGALTATTGALGGGVAGTGAGINPANQENLLAQQRRGTTPAPGENLFRQLSNTMTNLPASVSDAVHSARESMSKERTFGLTSNEINMSRSSASFTPISDYVPAGKQLAQSIPTTNIAPTANQIATVHTTTGMAHTGAPIPVVLAHGSAINVNFSGTCPHCGHDVHTTEVGSTVSPQALSTYGR